MSKRHEGWYPVYEEAIRTIERTFDREGARRKAIAAYHALLRIENLEGKSTFSRSINSIAKDMNYSYPHAAEGLRLVQAAGLCKIEEQFISGSKEKSPSIYTVLPVRTKCSKVGTKGTKVSTDSEIGSLSENSQELLQEHSNNIHSSDHTSRKYIVGDSNDVGGSMDGNEGEEKYSWEEASRKALAAAAAYKEGQRA
jgi:hypothetical protein